MWPTLPLAAHHIALTVSDQIQVFAVLRSQIDDGACCALLKEHCTDDGVLQGVWSGRSPRSDLTRLESAGPEMTSLPGSIMHPHIVRPPPPTANRYVQVTQPRPNTMSSIALLLAETLPLAELLSRAANAGMI